MRRIVIGGGVLLFLVFGFTIGMIFWRIPSGRTTQTIVSVEEGTVEVSNAADPYDRQMLRPGQRVSSSQGMLFGIEAIPTPTLPAGGSNSIAKAMAAAAAQRTPLDQKAAPQSATVVEKESYEIAGSVRTEKGQPISGAKILLHYLDDPKERRWFSNENEGKLAGKTFTNNRGYYTITLDGPHRLQVASFPSSDYLALRERVEITQTEKKVQKDFTHPEAKLCIKGRVFDAKTEKPIAGAEIKARAQRKTDMDFCPDIVKSGEDGSFIIPKLVSGVYRLEAMAEGYIRFDPRESEDAELLNITVSEQTQEREYTLKMNPGFAATVTVLDSQKKPVADAEVCFMRNTENFNYAGWGKTDAQGVCKNTELPAEPLAVRVKKESYGSAIGESFQPGAQKNPTQIAVILSESNSIAGRIANAKNQPAADRTVFVEFLKIPGWKNIFYESVKTGSDGAYTVKDLSPGKYRVAISKDDWLPNADQSNEVELKAGEKKTGIDFIVKNSGEIRGAVVDVNGKPVKDVYVLAAFRQGDKSLDASGAKTDEQGEFHIIDLPESSADTVLFQIQDDAYTPSIQIEPANQKYYKITLEPKSSLRGRVVNAKREPVAGASVSPIVNKSAQKPFTIFTQDDGSFQINALNSDRYMLLICSEGYSDAKTDLISVGKSETVDAGTIVLDEGVAVTGTVTDSQGAPLSGAKLTLYSKIEIPAFYRRQYQPFDSAAIGVNPSDAGISGQDGGFTIDHFPLDGDVLVVSHKDYAAEYVVVTPSPIQQAPITIQLTHGGTLEGRVLDDRGKPQANVSVQANHSAMVVYPQPSTNTGRRRNLYLVPGIHYVKKGDVKIIGPLEILPQEGDEEHTLIWPYKTKSDADGRYRFDHLTPGTYWINWGDKTESTAGQRDTKILNIDEGQTARCDFGGSEILAQVCYKGQPLDFPVSIQFFEMKEGAPQELPYRKDSEPGVYRLSGMREGSGELYAVAKGEKQQLLSTPIQYVLENGKETRLSIDLIEGDRYCLFLAPPAGKSIQPPIIYEVLDLPQPLRMKASLISAATEVLAVIPRGNHRVRLALPGFQPAVFRAVVMVKESSHEIVAPSVPEITIPLIAR